MTITTYSFAKDKKSTKRPTSNGTQYNIVLKENTSVDNPTFILTHNGVPTFDYCQWIFGYYFVEDIKLQSKDVYEVNCKLDVLATYRDDILASTQFVIRSASDYNTYLEDEKMHNGVLVNKTMNYTDCGLDGITGCYILRVMGYSAQGEFPYGIPTYVCNRTKIRSVIQNIFARSIFNETSWNLDKMCDLFKQLFMSPDNYVLSINWLPISLSDIAPEGTIEQDIYCGWWNTLITAPVLTREFHVSLITLNTPNKYFNDFRDYDERYTRFELSIPFVGVVPMSPQDVYDGIHINVYVEYLTGNITYLLYTEDDNSVLAEYTANLNTTIQVGGASPSLPSSSIVGAIKDITTGLSSPNYNTIGNYGSRVEAYTNRFFRLVRRIYNTSQYGTARVGRPLNEMRTLSNLSGFCQCENAKLDTTAYGIIKDEIIDYMNEGFFIE